MGQRGRDSSIVFALLLLAAVVFTIGIDWGLPSRKTDPFLFGERTPWSGAEILKLAPQRNGSAADVDVNPAARGSIVNDTDAKRAEIVRRYRLFTYQPDEMITLMALGQMHPSQRDFDPRLYQYGGLWIYPVGGLIRTLLHPKNDQAYYLDHPGAFAKFYIVARAYSAAWGVIGAWAVYALLRPTSRRAAIFATLLYITMPVVVNMAHEAKPHLAGTVLMLLAALAGRAYVERGGWRRLILTSTLCGAAAGMILSAMVALLIAIVAIGLRAVRGSRDPFSIPTLRGGEGGGEAAGDVGRAIDSAGERGRPTHPNPLSRGRQRGDQSVVAGEVRKRLSFGLLAAFGKFPVAGLIMFAVYAATNPYVIKHLLFDRAVLLQNLGNSKAMYHADLMAGIVRAVELIAAGSGWLVLVGGGVGTVALLMAARRRLSTDADMHERVASGRVLSSAAGFSPLVSGLPIDPASSKTSGLKPAAEDETHAARSTSSNLSATLLPLVAVSSVVAIQFAALAAGKPGEYGRFALVLDVTLALVLATAESVVSKRWLTVICYLSMFGNVAVSSCYVLGFWSDSRNITRRDELAATLANLQSERGLTTIGVVDEPAPYLLPPIDLWKWKITLLPHDATLATAGTQVVVRPANGTGHEPQPRDGYRFSSDSRLTDYVQPQIGWGMKFIEVWVRIDPQPGRQSH